MPIQLWYINQMTNNDNSKPLLDMLGDLRRVKNGVFTATMKVNGGIICDYMLMENDNYVKPAGTEDDKVPRRGS